MEKRDEKLNTMYHSIFIKLSKPQSYMCGSNKGLLAPEARDIPHILHVILLLCGNNPSFIKIYLAVLEYNLKRKKSGQMDGRKTDARQRLSHNNRSEEPSTPVS